MASFINDDFMLQNETGRRLYREYAADMPIFDYHCHLSPEQIADDVRFANITQLWLYGDHYKWRLMRADGVDERFVTGDADDYEKFLAWARVVPHTIGNPLYHWTHLELKRYFNVDELLGPDTAKKIWKQTEDVCVGPEFSVRNLIQRMNVKVVCTTDDPTDSLEHHKTLQRAKDFNVKVLPAFRPDKALAVEDNAAFNAWVDRLQAAADMEIVRYDQYLEALRARHTFFHEMGCRLSDHALTRPFFAAATEEEVSGIFDRARTGQALSGEQVLQFKTALLRFVGELNAEREWTMQFHIGALRNNNTRMFRSLGRDTGFDSMGDGDIAEPLSRFLDSLALEQKLPKTIFYSLNSNHNEILATMAGNFQDGTVKGKMQLGSAWWFNDQREGMEAQMKTLANMGLLYPFVGMLTDSRSFLSYPRHEYFRRILCNLIGEWVERGEAPADMELLGEMVQGICYNNAVDYFGIPVD
jgi:glucuronate isomerase